MIDAINEIAQNVNANSNVLFSNSAIRTSSASCCGWLQHDEGSGQFTLTKPGIYEILFNGNVTSATEGAITLALKSNGEQLTGTEMDSTVVTANTYSNVSANRYVKVCGGSRTITVSNVGTLATLVKNANIMIKKVA